MLAINLSGFFHITQRAVAQMLKRGSGHIVQITSSLDENVSSSARSAIAALTKGGLNVATKSLAVEYPSRGIRVNAVAPGATKTSMHRPEMYELLAKQHPIGRLGEVHEIVEAVLYLESAGFVAGEILHVDGGQSAGF
jgi:NAD(P)-dependent dehydrogenase (short-subunit alcohol dehydrogenase family)